MKNLILVFAAMAFWGATGHAGTFESAIPSTFHSGSPGGHPQDSYDPVKVGDHLYSLVELRGWDPTYRYSVFKYRLKTMDLNGRLQGETKFELSMHIGDWAVVNSRTAYVVVTALCGFYGCPGQLQAAVLKFDLGTGQILSTRNVIPPSERNVASYFFLLPTKPDLTLKWQTYKKIDRDNVQYFDQKNSLSDSIFKLNVTKEFGR